MGPKLRCPARRHRRLNEGLPNSQALSNGSAVQAEGSSARSPSPNPRDRYLTPVTRATCNPRFQNRPPLQTMCNQNRGLEEQPRSGITAIALNSELSAALIEFSVRLVRTQSLRRRSLSNNSALTASKHGWLGSNKRRCTGSFAANEMLSVTIVSGKLLGKGWNAEAPLVRRADNHCP